MTDKRKRRRVPDPVFVFNHTAAGLSKHLDDLARYEREEQEQLAEMMDPAYQSLDGLYQGQTFAGARDVFIASHVESLEGIYRSIKITKERIERMKA